MRNGDFEMTIESTWRRQIQDRFSDRKDIGFDEAYTRYWKHLPEADVRELFNLIAVEFGVSAGLIRPGDSLDKLVVPVKTKNPLLWLAYQTAAGDKQNEISYQLNKRLKRFGTTSYWTEILTVDELLRAWCGLPSQVATRGGDRDGAPQL